MKKGTLLFVAVVCGFLGLFMPAAGMCMGGGLRDSFSPKGFLPEGFSDDSLLFLRMHHVCEHFEDSWSTMSQKDCKEWCEALQDVMQHASWALKEETLFLIADFFLYHRPFNVVHAATFIDMLFRSVLSLADTLHKKLSGLGVVQEIWEVLPPHKQLLLFVIAHHPSAAGLMRPSIIDTITRDDMVEKFMIAYNLVRMHAARSDLFSYWPLMKYRGYDVVLDCMTTVLCGEDHPFLGEMFRVLEQESFEFEKAFFYDDVEYVTKLMVGYSDWNSIFFRWGYQAVHCAALAGASRLAELFIDQGIIFDTQTHCYAISGNCRAFMHHDKGFSYAGAARELFREAIRWHRHGLADFLLTHYSIEYHDIVLAVRSRNSPYFLWIIRNTPNVSTSVVGVQALNAAARCGGMFFAKILLDLGVDVDQRCYATYETPLYAAIHALNVSMVDFLLQAGSSVHNVFMGGEGPLHRLLLRIMRLDEEGVYWQREAFKDYFYKKNRFMIMPKQTWNRFEHQDAITAALAITRRLLAAGAFPNMQDTYGKTPTHLAAQIGVACIFDELKKAGGRGSFSRGITT